MITYLYWIIIIGLAVGALLLFVRVNTMKPGLVSMGIILFVGWLAYVFYFEQIFVKRYGGVMSITVPEGQVHIAATWKDDNLWVENYDPRENTCHFTEYSRGNILQGRVVIKNCNPRIASDPAPAPRE